MGESGSPLGLEQGVCAAVVMLLVALHLALPLSSLYNIWNLVPVCALFRPSHVTSVAQLATRFAMAGMLGVRVSFAACNANSCIWEGTNVPPMSYFTTLSANVEMFAVEATFE